MWSRDYFESVEGLHHASPIVSNVGYHFQLASLVLLVHLSMYNTTLLYLFFLAVLTEPGGESVTGEKQLRFKCMSWSPCIIREMRRLREGNEYVELAGSVIDDLGRDLAHTLRKFERHKRLADAARELCGTHFRAGNWDRSER